MKKLITYKLPLMLLLCLLYACGEENVTKPIIGKASLSVSISSVEEDVEDFAANDSKKASASQSDYRQGTLHFSESTKVEYSLDRTNSSPLPRIGSKGSTEMKAAIVRKPLEKGIQYNVLVYNESGDYVTEQVYNYGSESSAPAMLLDAGKTYTFLSYALNQANVLPTVVDKQKLSTVKLSKVAGDLMVFTKKLKLVEGDNFLSIVLKHRYSKITTQLSVDPSTVGTFKNLINVSLKPAYDHATYSFADNTFEYAGLTSNGCPVTFPAVSSGLRTITSNPSLVISPLTTAGVLNFGSITIDDETKANFAVPNVKITPGVSYTLKLNFKTCTEDVGSVQGLNWNYPVSYYWGQSGIYKDGRFYKRGETISQTIIAPGADYGYVFNITDLDNAFNMELNGVKLAKNEIQFERGASSPQNIRFKDQSMYQGVNTEGGPNIWAIYNMKGTTANPLVKIVIGKNGEVTLFGSKVSGGPLYELELFNGNSFNVFRWNTSTQGNNTIKVTQLVDEKTVLIGSGAGKKKVACK